MCHCVSYEEEDTCARENCPSPCVHEEEDTCVIRGGGYMCHSHSRWRYVSYEEEDTCVIAPWGLRFRCQLIISQLIISQLDDATA